MQPFQFAAFALLSLVTGAAVADLIFSPFATARPMGHKVVVGEAMGSANTIVRVPDVELEGASDLRPRGTSAVGYETPRAGGKTSMTLNVGVIGVGKIGQEHIRRLTETLAGTRVVAVSDADQARAQEVAARIKGASAHATGEELIAAKAVDAIIVTSWGATHAAYVLAAINAGKPVFCEKPMADTEADCSAILDAESAFERRLVQVGFMRRFDKQYRAMKETIQKGAIGSPLMFHSVHRNASSPRHFKATMAITDTAVHDIDIARFVLDDEPIAITVRSPRANRRAGGVADPLLLLMDMRSGALVTIETSVHIAYGYDIRGEVIGETGTVSLAEQSDVVIKTDGLFSGRVFDDWPARFDPAFDAEFRAWIAAAAMGGAAGPSAWDGYVATAATLAGVRALESGTREPIKLRERPPLYAP